MDNQRDEISTEINRLMDKMLAKSFGLLMDTWEPDAADLHRMNLRMAGLLMLQRSNRKVSPVCSLDGCPKAKRVD